MHFQLSRMQLYARQSYIHNTLLLHNIRYTSYFKRKRQGFKPPEVEFDLSVAINWRVILSAVGLFCVPLIIFKKTISHFMGQQEEKLEKAKNIIPAQNTNIKRFKDELEKTNSLQAIGK